MGITRIIAACAAAAALAVTGCGGGSDTDNSTDSDSSNDVASSEPSSPTPTKADHGKPKDSDSGDSGTGGNTETLCTIARYYIDDGMPQSGPMNDLPYENREEIAQDVDIMTTPETNLLVSGLLLAITRYADEGPKERQKDADALLATCDRLGLSH